MIAVHIFQVPPVYAAFRQVSGAYAQLPVRAVLHGFKAVVAPHAHML